MPAFGTILIISQIIFFSLGSMIYIYQLQDIRNDTKTQEKLRKKKRENPFYI